MMTRGTRWLPLLLALGVSGASAGGLHAKSRAKQRYSRRHKKPKTPVLEDLVTQEIQRILPKGLQLSTLDVPRSLERVAAATDLVSLKWRSQPRRGRAVVQVLVHRKNGTVRKGWARIELVELEAVVVAAMDLEAGALIGPGDLVVEERPMSGDDGIRMRPDFLIGSRVVAPLKAGQTVGKNQVTMPIPVARGSQVRVTVKRGRVIVSAQGVLEQKALIGASARVRVAGRVLQGRLVDSGEVLIDGGSL